MHSLPRAMPALITPFDRRGELSLGAHRHNIETMWRLGVRGLLVAGSTGEGPYLETGERHTLVAEARRTAARLTIVCGIHAETVRGARNAMAEAGDGGADAVLVATPTTLVRHRPDLIQGFFEDVVDGASIPVLLYSVPKVMGVELSEAAAIGLAGAPNVVGMKDSGGDPVRAGRIAGGAGPQFSLFAGATSAVALSVAAGAYGAITASANYAPRLLRETVTAARRSVRASAPFQGRLAELAGAVEAYGVSGVKYAATRIGLRSGHSRRPLGAVTPEARRAIRRAMAAADLS